VFGRLSQMGWEASARSALELRRACLGVGEGVLTIVERLVSNGFRFQIST
jgi:hypothetical protein